MEPKNIVILADGSFPQTAYPLSILNKADIIICCDGAILKLLEHTNLMADYIVGDMDTLDEENKLKFKDIIIHNPDQQTNDQTKAFRWALENVEDISQIYILGATGEREDHTIGNISLLMEYARTYDLEGRGINVEMVSDHATIFAVTDTCEVDCGEGRRISIFSPDNSLRIKSEGLEWPTDEVVFDNWWKATLNRASQDHVKLKFSHRSIALIMMD